MKRATDKNYNIDIGAKISIHALMKRATTILLIITQCQIDFNPRPHEEGDHLYLSEVL